MKRIIKVFNKIGLFEKKFTSHPVPAEVKAYVDQNDENKSKAHMDYLKGLSDEEEKRLNIIESKSSQLVGQTGLIFSLLSLFIPILVDKIGDLAIGLKILLLLFLLLSLAFYLLTIKNALKNYNVKQFKYSSPAPANVQDFHNKSIAEFNSEVIRDLLASIHTNTALNNRKATSLIQSYTSFRIANSITGILVIIFCSILLFVKPKLAENNTTKKISPQSQKSVPADLPVKKAVGAPDTTKLHGIHP